MRILSGASEETHVRHAYARATGARTAGQIRERRDDDEEANVVVARYFVLVR